MQFWPTKGGISFKEPTRTQQLSVSGLLWRRKKKASYGLGSLKVRSACLAEKKEREMLSGSSLARPGVAGGESGSI